MPGKTLGGNLGLLELLAAVTSEVFLALTMQIMHPRPGQSAYIC